MKANVPGYRGYRFPPEIISHAVWLYHRFCLSFRDVETSGSQPSTARTESCVSPIYAHPETGLPWGRYARLLLVWACTEAVKTKCPVLEFGTSLSSFMIRLGLIPSGGARGTIHRLREQMKRLASASIAYTYDASEVGHWRETGFRLAEDVRLWWRPSHPTQLTRPGSRVQLSRRFFEAIVDRPVSIDLRAVRALRSPMALDIYGWLTYRSSYLKRPTRIPWPALRVQLGSGYSRARAFRGAFLRHAATVLVL